ncbi:MAG TPA: beta-propeller fold lactonase family protein [Syntrophales bacterium]|nr:beta-propeller fold lactonase family protein [Syntrophales bacterium]HQM28642.1 beta-propeller fold lactonase family protein [Syntrophales bacterium]
MKNLSIFKILSTVCLVLLFLACGGGGGGGHHTPISKDITSFTISAIPGSNTTIGTNTITVQVPFGTDVTALEPTIVHNGATIDPASGVAQDFSGGPVTYTVTAQNGSTKVYAVTVTEAPNTACDIITFAIPSGTTQPIQPNTITVQVAYGTDVTALAPTITVSPGATIDPASGVAQDFTTPQTYTVTAMDGVTQKTYKVTVTEAPNTAAEILTFAISGSGGTVGPNTVAVTMPYGTDVTALAPTITVSPGATIDPASGVAQDFTTPQTYTVTAMDGVTQKTYKVTVTEAPNTAAEILTFAISGSGGTVGPNTVAVTMPYGTDVTALAPTITVSPGATIDPASGVAQDFTTPQTYTVTAMDGVTQKTYTVTVTEAPNTACNITSFTISGINGTIGLDTVTLQVPFWMSLTALTPTIAVSPGASVVPASGVVQDFSGGPVTYTVTAQDGTTTKDYTMTVTAASAPTPKYAYVANQDSHNVSQFTIGADGSLAPMATPTVGAGFIPVAITVDPSGRFTYVANYVSNTVSQYTIDADGSLTPMAVPTVDTGSGPAAVTVDPTGHYAYVANWGSDNVSQYTIGADGSLTPNGTVGTGNQPYSVTIHPSGNYAYVANAGDDNISQYTIGATGLLEAMDPATVDAGDGPRSVMVNPSGGYAYAANVDSNNISQYTIGADGSLAPMATPVVPAGDGPRSVTVDSSGRYAYVANYDDDNISQYTIGADGSLTPMAVPTVDAGDGPRSVTVDPSGKYAYVANYVVHNVSQYTIGADGALTPMVAPTVGAGIGPAAIVITVGY